MCIVLKGQDGVIEQARRQLEDLVSDKARVLNEAVNPKCIALIVRYRCGLC
jgi:acetolactate synthase small subunit